MKQQGSVRSGLRRLAPVALTASLLLGGAGAASVAIAGPALADSCGAVQATYNGVDVKSNFPDQGTGTSCGGTTQNTTLTPSGGTVTTGFEWQCVEFVNRYYAHMGWISSHWSGNGNTLKDNLPSGLTYTANGSITTIVVGDVVTLDDGAFGHAGVVVGVSGNTITIANQNASSVTATATFNPSTETLSSEFSGFTTQGVVHAAANTGSGTGSSSGVQMMLDPSGNVWAKNDSVGIGGWTLEASGQSAIAAGGGIQMMLDTSGNVWAKSDTSIGNSGWTEEQAGGMTAIAAGSGGFQMMMNAYGTVYAKNGVGVGGWTQEVTGQSAIAAGGGTQMLLDTSGNVWAKSSSSIGSGGWTQEQSGGMSAIAAGNSGFQMMMNGSGTVYAKNGVGVGGWTQEATGQVSMAAGGGTQMMLDTSGNVWAKSTGSISGSGWTEEEAGGESAITAGANGFQMMLDTSGNVWAKSSVGIGGWTQEQAGVESAIAAD